MNECSIASIILTAVGIIVPIILTIINTVLAIQMDNKGKRLQRLIYNRDVENQTRDSIINIYNSFLEVFHISSIWKQSVELFAFGRYNEHLANLTQAGHKMINSFNIAKLILSDDKKLLSYLQRILSDYKSLVEEIDRYVSFGQIPIHLNNAWGDMSKRGIIIGDMYSVFYNSKTRADFAKYFENKYTEEICKKATSLVELLESDDFDNLFKEYVSIKKL